MLDKRTARLMDALIKFCSDGSYKIIEVGDLVKAMLPKFKVTPEFISQTIKYIADNELIDVKYSDSEKYCIAVLPKGRIFDENNKKVGGVGGIGVIGGVKSSRDSIIGKGIAILIIAGCFIAAFAGAFLANLIFK